MTNNISTPDLPVEVPKSQTLRAEVVVQLCVDCWRTRYGGNGRMADRIRSDTREESYCGACGKVTDFGNYRVYPGEDVHVIVPARVVDGPRAGLYLHVRLSAAHVELTREDVTEGVDLYRVQPVGTDVRLWWEGLV